MGADEEFVGCSEASWALALAAQEWESRNGGAAEDGDGNDRYDFFAADLIARGGEHGLVILPDGRLMGLLQHRGEVMACPVPRCEGGTITDHSGERTCYRCNGEASVPCVPLFRLTVPESSR